MEEGRDTGGFSEKLNLDGVTSACLPDDDSGGMTDDVGLCACHVKGV